MVATKRNLQTSAPGIGGRVLVVSDHAQRRRTLAAALIGKHEVFTSEELLAGITLIVQKKVDVVLIDAVQLDADQLDEIQACCPDAQVVALLEQDLGQYVGDDIVFQVMHRSNALEHVSQVVQRAVERGALHQYVQSLENKLRSQRPSEQIISACKSMDKVFKLAHAAASVNGAVLLVGESGTGKELLARAIHHESWRSAKPFVMVECAVLDENTLDNELWIQPESPQCNADCADRVSSFVDRAQGGTLCLADINKLPLKHQAQVAAWLQMTASANTTLDASFARLIATSCEELKPAVDAGTFRKDLYFQLQGRVLRLPPLRRRKEDIPILAYYFMHRAAQRAGRQFRKIGTEALKQLREQRWPGNVRQLEHVIQIAVAAAQGDVISPKDISFLREFEQDAGTSSSAGHESSTTVFDPALMDLPYSVAKTQAIRMFEQLYMREVLERAGGNISAAARQSGLDRSNFRKILKKVNK